MSMLRCLNNRLIFPPSQEKKDDSIGQGSPFSFSWHKFFQGSKGRIAGKIGGSELLALEYSYRWLRLPFPSSVSWRRAAERVHFFSGVFPIEKTQFKNFLDSYKNAISALDAIYLWQTDPYLKKFEEILAEKLSLQALRLSSRSLGYPLILDLADLKWLVVSPFTETMKLQVGRMREIHPARGCKENFKDFERRCQFLKCPTYSHLQPSPFSSWTEGLERLTKKALEFKFDLAVVGAGAWSLPLLANLKKEGRSGIHLGGATQLLFGIKGKRWDHSGYYNRAWVRPDPRETPSGTNKIEQGCYW